MTQIVVHVPHASVQFPDDVWSQFTATREEAEAEAIASADLYTDLIVKDAWPHADVICAEVPRIVVDVECYADDAREEMAQVGRGVIYTHDHMGKAIRKPPDRAQRDDLLSRYYVSHWQRLKAAAVGAVLIDLHPIKQPPNRTHRLSALPAVPDI